MKTGQFHLWIRRTHFRHHFLERMKFAIWIVYVILVHLEKATWAWPKKWKTAMGTSSANKNNPSSCANLMIPSMFFLLSTWPEKIAPIKTGEILGPRSLGSYTALHATRRLKHFGVIQDIQRLASKCKCKHKMGLTSRISRINHTENTWIATRSGLINCTFQFGDIQSPVVVLIQIIANLKQKHPPNW